MRMTSTNGDHWEQTKDHGGIPAMGDHFAQPVRAKDLSPLLGLASHPPHPPAPSPDSPGEGE